MSIFSFFKPAIAYAQEQALPTAMTGARSLTDEFGSRLYGGTDANFFQVMGVLINVLLSILGVILLGFIIVAGFYWITAGGNSSQVEKAKTLIQNAVIGLVIILVALSLSQFIQTALIDQLGEAPSSSPAPNDPGPGLGADDGYCPGGVC